MGQAIRRVLRSVLREEDQEEGGKDMIVRMIRNWEDLGVRFEKGGIYPLNDARQVKSHGAWHFGLYQISKAHTEIITESYLMNLKDEVESDCSWRGHVMGDWNIVHTHSGRTIHRAECVRCGMEVDIDLNPPPNGIEVSGEAVAPTCNGREDQR